MRGSPFFQKKTHYGLAVILVIILLSSLFDSREHFNLHIKMFRARGGGVLS